MVADGAGFGIMPEFAARRARRSMLLTSLRLTDPWATRRLLLCTGDRTELEPLALSLLQHLASTAGLA